MSILSILQQWGKVDDMDMTLEEIKSTEWYKRSPDIIKQAIYKLPPTTLYKFKNTGKQCIIMSYDEPDSGKYEDVRLTVQKTGKGGVLSKIGFSRLDMDNVFDVRLDDIEPWVD